MGDDPDRSAESAGSVPPPPRQPIFAVWRRIRLSFDALPPFSHWLVYVGSWLALGLVVVYVLSGIQLGWVETYNIFLSIDSPFAADRGAVATTLAATLSIAGWLATPALIGGMVGYVVERSIGSHRTHDPPQG